MPQYPYSTTVSGSNNTVTVGNDTYSFNIATDTDEWDYSYAVTGASGTIGTGKTVVGTVYATKKQYPVYITAGTGVKSVYLSTNSGATSGSASGTNYAYGTRVYGFITLAKYYENNGWQKVGNGTDNAEDTAYRVGNLLVDTDNNFGTLNATRKQVTITLTASTGVSAIYYRAGTSGG